MHLVINEGLAGVEFASGLSAKKENIASLNNSPTMVFRSGYSLGDSILPETSYSGD